MFVRTGGPRRNYRLLVPAKALADLEQRGVDLAGVQQVAGAQSFRWSGRYEYDMNERHTLDIQLNVFADFAPTLPPDWQDCGYVFLANIQPALQLKVLDQVTSPVLTICDTIDFWIETARDELLAVLSRGEEKPSQAPQVGMSCDTVDQPLPKILAPVWL